jgi:Xaa-Pro aminopeptidase
MEYSAGAAIPYVARVDAGTIEMVRRAGPEIVSSADLVQLFEARWTPAQKELHDQAARGTMRAKDEAFELIRERIRSGKGPTESEVQALIQARFTSLGLTTDHPCIVAVNEHASDPHFETSHGERDKTIERGDLVLIDLWSKVAGDARAVYYDATWMGYCGSKVPPRIDEVWNVVRGARDAAIDFVASSVRDGKKIRGCEVDDVARKHISDRGFGDYFLHRTGHSIGYEVHGNGVNIDNLETRDQRAIIPGVCFSIEPGVYLPDFGIRSEIDMFVSDLRAEVTGDIQRELLLLAD